MAENVKKVIRVRIVESMAGLPMPEYGGRFARRGGWSFEPDDIVDLPADLAIPWIACGNCEEVDQSVAVGARK